MTWKEAIVACLSSSNEVSFGRTISAIAFVSCLLWDTFFVGFSAVHYVPQHLAITDILPPSERLIGQVEFCAASYSINKLSEIVSAFKK